MYKEFFEKVVEIAKDDPESVEFARRVISAMRDTYEAIEAAQQSVQADWADICPHCGRLNKLHCGCNEVAE